MKIEIENGIPIPERRNYQGYGEIAANYPYRSLEVGQSFLVQCREGESPDQVMRRVVGQYQFYQRKTGKQFTARQLGDGTVRFWRIK